MLKFVLLELFSDGAPLSFRRNPVLEAPQSSAWKSWKAFPPDMSKHFWPLSRRWRRRALNSSGRPKIVRAFASERKFFSPAVLLLKE